MDGPPIAPELLDSFTPEVRKVFQALIDYYEERMARYERRIADLEAEIDRLNKNPRNSSLPPSSEHPHAKPAPEKPKSKRRRGGQKGHPKHDRPLIPVSQCQTVVEVVPRTCRRCGGRLAGWDATPLRHQVWEIPEIKPEVSEYQLHRVRCRCGAVTCGALPPGAPVGQAGPRLVAFAALLMGCFRQSKRRVALFMGTVLNQPCSPGWVVKLQNQATAALRPAFEDLKARLPAEPHLSIDETPTKEAARKAWLWTAVAGAFTFFVVRPTREATALADMLGDAFKGTVNCDRAKMYHSLPRVQWCWAHLVRDFQSLIDSHDGVMRRLGHDLMRPTKEMFELLARRRDGTLTREAWKAELAPIRERIDALLLRGAFARIGIAKELWAHRERLWTFVDVEGVEPTNNASERALRHAVIWRKLSFGTQSAAGSRFVETLLTVVETCRRQSRSAFAFITAAVQARLARHAPLTFPGV
jgi:transposase